MATIILSHETALAWWRATATATATLSTPSSRALSREDARRALEDTAGSVHARMLASLRGRGELDGLPEPLDLLTAERNDRRSTRRARFHCMQTELPEGSLMLWKKIKLDDGSSGTSEARIYLPTPEFCFVQMAHHLGEIELAELGCELCGRYDGTSPLTTPAKLLDYATRAEQMTGAKRARKVAAHVLANARGPQQAKLALMASLPRAMGGIGTPAPVLDHVIEVPDAIARVLGSRTRRPDLFWPEISTAVEYEARTWNDATAHAEFEERKADAYRRMGLEVISITRAQVEDLEALRRVFEIVVRACGKRRKPVNERQASRQAATHRELFGSGERYQNS